MSTASTFQLHSQRELAQGFRRLGVAAGDTVMLHASVRAVGEVAGGPDVIHLALKDALGADGTLLMYASCPAYVDEIGRGNLTEAQEREVFEKLPAFDPVTARSQRENGALVELFRTYPGTIVNPHVARFALWGRQARHLATPQPWDYAVGRGSVLERFLELGGKILLLGSDPDNTTFLHYVEHVADFSEKRIATFKVPVDVDGIRVWREMREVDTSGAGAHANWPDQFFARIVGSYLAKTENQGAEVGSARSFLIDARGLCDFAVDVMIAVAHDAGAADRLLPPPRPEARGQ